MGANTSIAWCDHTFNPWIGCSKVHTGCAHCYAEADMDKRRHRVQWGPRGTRSKTSADYWLQPKKWDKKADRPRIFCASLCDVFEDWKGPIVNYKGMRIAKCEKSQMQYAVGDTWYPHDGCRLVTMDDLRRDLFQIIDDTPNLDWLLLTKRPENIRRMLYPWNYRENVWLGTSISDQETADRFVPEFLKCRDLVPVLFLSVEPILGPIQLEKFIRPDMDQHGDGRPDWVIIGGESGPKARSCHVEWILDIINQCHHAEVPCFVKQLGSNAQITVNGVICGLNCDMNLKDSKGGNPDEWPENLRIREFPL